jgi:Tol biopolymer transport system component
LQPGGNPILTRLTTDTGLTTDGTISSDGKLVAFASDRANPENLDIWVKPIDVGSPPVRLTTHPADDYDPTFSPDGTRIAFRSERDGGGIMKSRHSEERPASSFLTGDGHAFHLTADCCCIGQV